MEPALGGGGGSARLAHVLKFSHQHFEILRCLPVGHCVKMSMHRKTRSFFGPFHENSPKHCIHVIGVGRHYDMQQLDERGRGRNRPRRG